jgi:predicted porin
LNRHYIFVEILFVNLKEIQSMNKKLITLAIAAAFAPAVAMADATVYGKVHMSVDSNSGYTTGATKQNGTEIVSNSSRLGVKGSEDLGGGLTALYQLETSVSVGSDNATQFAGARDSYVGLAGGFGAMLVGRLPLSNQYVYDVNYFADQVGDAGNFTGNLLGAGAVAHRVSNAIAYASPAMGGFSALVAFVPDTLASLGAPNVPAKTSSYTLRGAYADGPIKAGLSYQNIGLDGGTAGSALGTLVAGTGTTMKATSLGGTYDFGMASVGLQYVRSALDTGTGTTVGGGAVGNITVSQNVYTLGGSFNVNANSAIKAQYSHAGDIDAGGTVANSGANMFAVGYDYNFSKRTTGYVAYARTSNGTAAAFAVNGYGHSNGTNTGAPATAGDDPSAFSIGLSHSF